MTLIKQFDDKSVRLKHFKAMKFMAAEKAALEDAHRQDGDDAYRYDPEHSFDAASGDYVFTKAPLLIAQSTKIAWANLFPKPQYQGEPGEKPQEMPFPEPKMTIYSASQHMHQSKDDKAHHYEARLEMEFGGGEGSQAFRVVQKHLGTHHDGHYKIDWREERDGGLARNYTVIFEADTPKDLRDAYDKVALALLKERHMGHRAKQDFTLRVPGVQQHRDVLVRGIASGS